MTGAAGRVARLLPARPFHVGVGCLAAGLASATAGPRLMLACAALVAGVLLACRAPRLAAVAGLLVLAGAVVGDARLAAIDAPARLVDDGAEVTVRAHLVSHPRANPFGASAEIAIARGPLAGARLLLRIPRWAPLPGRARLGAEYVLTGRLRELPDPRAESPSTDADRSRSSASSFDFAAHLRRRAIHGELLLDRARRTDRRRGGLAGLLDRLRERAEGGVAAGLADAEAALARGMVLGQDERIDDATRADWRDSGLAHLLAVSGQNVMLLVALALPFIALAGTGPRARGLALLALVLLYVPLAGAGPSLQRAGIMGAAAIAATLVSRPSSAWYALLLAAAATLALNPRACADPGWQLSFAAVAGILLAGRPLGAVLVRGIEEIVRGRVALALARGLGEGAAITLAATVSTAPLVALHFGSVPIAGLPANLVALPAVAPAMWLGMVKAALGMAAALVPAADWAAEALGAVARVPLVYLQRVAERGADLPGGQAVLPVRSPLSVVGAYALMGLAASGAARWLRGRRAPAGGARAPSRAAPGGPAARAGLGERAAAWRRAQRSLRAGVAVVVAALLVLLGAWLLGSPRPPGELTVRFLDVGQGDATLVQHPDGTAVLFDGGPPEGGVVRLLRRAGVRRLAVVVATHASRDHHGGLAEVLARYDVGLLLDGGDGSGDPAFRDVLREAARRGVRVVPALAPMSLAAGSVRVRVLSPPPRPPGPAPEDPNARAVVAVVSVGAFDLLLSADAESDALLPLALPDVDAMKVPHHGSADPGLPAALGRLRPRLAAIEVGPNTYGHPAPSTLRALERAGVTTYRTDRDGTVTLTVAEGRIRVATDR